MRDDIIRDNILNNLINSYESSKTFHGTNKKKQIFSLDIAILFPEYSDDSDYDSFYNINNNIQILNNKGYVSFKEREKGVVEKVVLNEKMINEICLLLNRIPKKVINEGLCDTWNQILQEIAGAEEIDNNNGNTYASIMTSYIIAQKQKLLANKPVEFFEGVLCDYKEFLYVVKQVLRCRQEVFIRDFSQSVLRDSKKMKKMKTKVQNLLFTYGNFLEKEYVLEECGIINTPTYVSIKGNANITIGEQKLKLHEIKGDIALSTETLKDVTNVEVLGSRIVTIENLTNFHDYSDENDFVLYLGGFHNRIKKDLLQSIYKSNKNKIYLHFGDIDAGGFRILEHLIKKTEIPFKALHMDIDTLVRNKKSWVKLTDNDKKNLNILIELLDSKADNEEEYLNYRPVLLFMLENNCKLEQESLNSIVID